MKQGSTKRLLVATASILLLNGASNAFGSTPEPMSPAKVFAHEDEVESTARTSPFEAALSTEAKTPSASLKINLNEELKSKVASPTRPLQHTQSSKLSRFSQLQQIFNNSSKPAESALLAAYSGRCFHAFLDSDADGPNYPVGAVLSGVLRLQTETPSEEAGPMFPSQKPTNRTLLKVLSNRYVDSDHYTRVDVAKLNADIDIIATPIALNGQDLAWKDTFVRDQAYVDATIRKSPQGYLVVKGELKTAFHHPKTIYCYFYKKLR